MAGPQNGFMASKKTVTVYSPTGEPLELSRPNAIDLIRTSGYSWNKEDAGKNRVESDGPTDPTSDVVVIYDLDGNGVEANKNNAREMVGRGTHRWTTNSVTESEAAEAVIEAAGALADAEAAQKAETPTEETLEESLVDEATRVIGSADVKAYLDGFSLEALKEIASERYEEKLHHRASKATAIEKIVELEEARQLVD